MFQQASKLKLRFQTKSGNVTAEDLWDLPLTSAKGASLDNLAKQLSKELKENSEESFVSVKTTKNAELELKFEIVKHVIKVKLEENEKSKNALVIKAKKQKIMELIEAKENEAMAAQGIDELKKALEEL